jgi:lysozyme
VATRKRKQQLFLRRFIFFTALVGGLFIFYLGYLWWKAEQVQQVRYREFGIPIPENYMIHGIDVSKYQDRISWESVHDMNVNGIRLGFVYIKATEGINNVDHYFKRNWKKSKEAGMIRGAYHFFISSKSGRMQAENFISQVDLETGDLPPVLDIEQNSSTPVALMQKEIQTWLDMVKQHYHVQPVIYTNISFYSKYLAGKFDEYPLWVAHYLQPEQPRIEREWIFWQHSETGHVNGVGPKVDFNVFNGDSTAFRALLLP